MDRIEQQLDGEAEVIKLDVLSQVGREAMRMYGIRGLPTLLVFDGCGERVAAYSGVLNAGEVVERVRSAEICESVGEPD